MSISFYPSIENHKPSARLVKCHFCTLHSDVYEHNQICTFCDGNGEYSEMDMPELNLANTNAIAMMGLIGIVPDYCGEVEVSLIPEIRRNILVQLNVKSLRAVAIRESVKECNVYSTGIDDEYIIDRLKAMDEILVYCQKHNDNFCWG